MPLPTGSPRWRRYLRFWGRDVAADIDDEIAFHFQSRVADLIASGLTPEAARTRAYEEFGDLTTVRRGLYEIDQRMARRADRLAWLDGWRQDIGYAARSLRRTPGVTIAVIATLALGLGANASMFSVLNAVFLRPPAGVVRPAEVYRLWTEHEFRSGRQFWPGYDHSQYRTATAALRGLASTTIYQYAADATVRRGQSTSRALKVAAASNYFTLLGVRPALGRFFTSDEDRLGAGQRLVVVSFLYWQRHLGADPAILGEPLRIDGVPYTLIGVAQRDFTGVELSAADMWVPLSSMGGYGDTPWWLDFRVNGFQILARAEPGVTGDAIGARVTQVLRNRDGGPTVAAERTTTRAGSIIVARGPGKRAQEVEIATRLGAVALVVLMIACANVVSLLLARAVRRRREVATRLALGISRARLTRLVLTESVMLALVAGVGAVLTAWWGGLALRALLLPDVHWAQPPIDWRVLAAAIATSLAAGLVAGIVPAVQSGATSLTDVLKSGAREGHGRRSRFRSLLVMAQVALSVALVVGAVLFVRSLSNVRGIDLGFDASRLIFARVEFETSDTHRDSLVPARLAEAADRLRTSAGVQSVALTAMRPMAGFSMRAYFPDADTLTHRKPEGMFWAVTPAYFATAGTRLVAGHGFGGEPSSGAGAPASVIVNTAMADALWPGENPLGRCVRFDKPDGRCNPVVGIVETARWGELIEESTPQFYLPLANMPFPGRARTIAVRADARMTEPVSRAVREVLGSVFPSGEPIVQSMAAALEPKYRPWRLGATLFSLFGALAGVVAALGVYSTVSHGVSQRTHEFGVRMALGARPRDVVRLVLVECARTVSVGVALGAVVAIFAGRLVAALLYGVSPRDPTALIGVGAALLLTALSAALLPAYRAARVSPLAALHSD